MGARGIGHTACSLELWLSMQNLGTKFPYIYYSPNSFIKKKKKGFITVSCYFPSGTYICGVRGGAVG